MPTRPYRNVRPQLGARCYIDETALVIGDVRLGDDVSIWPMVVARGDVNYIQVGARSNIQDGTVVHVSRPRAELPEGWPCVIGEDTTIGHKVVVHGCRIGNRCLIGIGAIVLDGAVIEDEVMVGAGSVVTPGKRLESGGLYLGNPARRVRELTTAERERLIGYAQGYVTLANEYR
jgi:carbonic anhydrase/acetyltransferase-like protein (isoleucine patch superfamily)